MATCTSWQPQSISIVSCTQRSNSQTLTSLLAHWPTYSQPPLLPSPGASRTTLYCCTQFGQFMKLSQRNIVCWGQSTTSLAPTRLQHGSKSSSSFSPGCVNSSCSFSFSCLSARSFHLVPPDVLARSAQDFADVYVFEQPCTMWPECAWGDASSARFVWHALSLDRLQFSTRLLHW